MKLIRTASILFSLTLALGAGGALALSTDSEKPIEIEADFAELDDTAGITVYRGNVVVTQGSMRMSGDKLTVNFTDEQELKNVFLQGRPARFKQRPDNKDVDTEGEAMQIEYHAKESLLYLIEGAKLNQGEKLITGHRITYDTDRSILTARKARTTEVAKDDEPTSGGRIRIIIPPKKKSD